jgi:hypothetical protein
METTMRAKEKRSAPKGKQENSCLGGSITNCRYCSLLVLVALSLLSINGKSPRENEEAVTYETKKKRRKE